MHNQPVTAFVMGAIMVAMAANLASALERDPISVHFDVPTYAMRTHDGHAVLLAQASPVAPELPPTPMEPVPTEPWVPDPTPIPVPEPVPLEPAPTPSPSPALSPPHAAPPSQSSSESGPGTSESVFAASLVELSGTTWEMAARPLQELNITSRLMAWGRAVRTVGTNPFVEFASEFLNVDNAKNIADTVAALKRQGAGGSINVNANRQLQQIMRELDGK